MLRFRRGGGWRWLADHDPQLLLVPGLSLRKGDAFLIRPTVEKSEVSSIVVVGIVLS